MRFFLHIIFILVTGFLLELFFPWWIIAVAAFIGALIFKPRFSFLAGFLGAGSLWLVEAWLLDSNGTAPLTEKVAEIFTVNKNILFAATFLVAGLTGGFASLTGSLLRPKKKRNLYY